MRSTLIIGVARAFNSVERRCLICVQRTAKSSVGSKGDGNFYPSVRYFSKWSFHDRETLDSSADEVCSCLTIEDRASNSGKCPKTGKAVPSIRSDGNKN